MKKILLLSDTHGYMGEDVLKHVKWADEVWHAGDIGTFAVTDAIQDITILRAVYGNIDDAGLRGRFPLVNCFECERVRVFMTHIGGYPGRYAKGVKEQLIIEGPKIFICGHSHILKVQYDHKLQLLHLNPGAVGKQGFHQVRTMLRFVIVGDIIKDLEIIELDKR